MESITNNYNSNSKFIETADYDFTKNKILISNINSNGSKLSHTDKIDIQKKYPNDIINKFGDIIKTENIEYEYKYDKLNNWIEKTEYKIINGIRQKYSSIKRKIKYKK